MLGTITAQEFEPLIKEEFTLFVHNDGAVKVTLTEVKENPLGLPEASSDRRTPFSLLFTGPDDTSFVSGTCTLEHPTLGKLEHVLVNRIVPMEVSEEPKAWFEIILA